jgi:hypothetical protein
MFSNKRYRDPQGNVHMLFQGDPHPDWVEVEFDPNQVPDPNYIPPYPARRMIAYPQISNQLDMLWHELNTNGSISADGEWFSAIKAVKDAHPKE